MYLWQELVVSELKKKHGQIKEKKLLGKDEVYHGALEDILLGQSFSRSRSQSPIVISTPPELMHRGRDWSYYENL